MFKKHDRTIPPQLLHRALDLLGYRAPTDDPQQAFIDLLDNHRSSAKLHDKTQLPLHECTFILNLRDIATASVCKTKN